MIQLGFVYTVYLTLAFSCSYLFDRLQTKCIYRDNRTACLNQRKHWHVAGPWAIYAPEEQTILRKYSPRVILHKHDRLLGYIRAGAMSSYGVYGLIYVKTDTWSTFGMTRSAMIDDRYRIPIVYSHTCLSFLSSRSVISIHSVSFASDQYGGFRQIPPPATTEGAWQVGDFKTMDDRIVYIVFHRLHQMPDVR